MKIVVLVKQVPRAACDISFTPESNLERTGKRFRLNGADECAVDQALRIAPWRRDMEITAVTMGPPAAEEALRRAMVLGADNGIHVCDARLSGSDALSTARVLAAVLRRVEFDLVLCGAGTSDSGMSAVPAMVAELLDVPALCHADTVTLHEHRLEVRRGDGAVRETLAADLPAVVSVRECCGAPRYPRFGATVSAREKPVRTWSLADIGMNGARVGLAGAATRVRAVTVQPRPRRVLAGEPSDVAARLADFLAERQFL
ncbi:electron transfer flavoprotein subunit beta [Virgisporangium aliadipatigenens]|uniref:Electron transfer flavoprotein subunit beta n=1 Tax=Virgisporangium aliadipatigenens TaxID=741659 RepID=A0A8J3YL18_9ACTN|nr:electron transfer flavoprotein subunit beta/FixA family protein [Virgisporangium aliadipatigenens]GIJ46267.1 electron transfer flavoprotein subunit beta [Virgisporangium aliadipatigenens]